MPNIYLYGGEANPNNIRLRQLPVDAPSLSGLTGTLTTLGLAAILSLGIVPPAGALTTGGWTPLLYPMGLQLTGAAPTVLQGTQQATTTAALTLTSYAPTIGLGVPSTAGALSLTGYSSSVSVSAASSVLYQRVIRGNDATGKDDWWISYQA